MTEQQPHIIVISGPNGSGKSTTAPSLLKGTLGVTEFVNADVIAEGLSAFQPEGAAFQAGRVMLKRIHHLAKERVDFAFETTLASRTFAPWIKELKQKGYIFHLVFLWLPSAEFAIARVAERVRLGGHNVPEETIRRRYNKGITNFFQLYVPFADAWRLYNNSDPSGPALIASAGEKTGETVYKPDLWNIIREEYHE
ncbi:MAG TPA: Zeta toxin family protein [Nitrospirae bacterium]|nr:zeta toxin [bacterium BMS3Abin06]HDH11500.1 Zeta toxin family protein [Nitrospirota bacterium]HDZ01985.1 Zeta toxin family protein [Nitrospirota bacterium]